MSRKKTKAERIRDGDTRKVGRLKLAAQLAAEPQVESGLPEVSPRLRGDAQAIYGFYRQQLTLSRIDAQSGMAAESEQVARRAAGKRESFPRVRESLRPCWACFAERYGSLAFKSRTT